MPANLTAQYLKAEQAYRRAETPDEELTCLQTMLRELPKHKGTDKLQAELKHKISRAKEQVERVQKEGKKGPRQRIPRQGAGRAILLGGPNAGKSALMNALTQAQPEVAPYPFTTHELSPGMMPWEDVMVQLIDTPPITSDMCDPTTVALIRGAELVLLLVDIGSDDGLEAAQQVLQQFQEGKTRLASESHLDEEDVGITYTATIVVATRSDLPESDERLELWRELCPLDWPEMIIAAEADQGLEALRDAIYEAMQVVRVYTKLPKEKHPNYDKPYTLSRGSTLIEMAQLVHKDFAENLKSARVWGSEVFDGTPVKGDYVLHDKDVVELHG